MKSAKKKMDEVSNEFDIYGQYVASELKNVQDQRAVLQAKYYINNILLQARMGTFNSGGYGDWWQGYGSGYRTASSASTHDDTSTPTRTPEPGEARTANSQDVLQFVNLDALVSQLEYDDSQ